MPKINKNPSAARKLFIASLLAGIVLPGTSANAQEAVFSQNSAPTMHLPAYNPSQPGPIAVLQAMESVREAPGKRVVAQPHLIQAAQRPSAANRPAPARNAPIAIDNVTRPQVIRITEERGQDSEEKEIEVQVVVQDATANQNGARIQRRGAPQNSDVPVYDGQPRTPAAPPASPMPGMRPHAMMWTPARGSDLDDQAEALDEIFETEIVTRMLELMQENFELKAEMKVKEVETRAQMEIAELKLGFAREQLEVRDRELDRRAEAFEQRARELDEQHEHLARSERGLDEMREEAEQQLRHAEERMQNAEQRIRATEEKHANATESLRRELEGAMQARNELTHRTRAMGEQIGALERQLAETLEQLEKAKASKPEGKRAEAKKPANKKPKSKSDDK